MDDGVKIGPAEWAAAFGDGSWEPTEQEIRRRRCRQKELERGVHRISENHSIVPASLVEELVERLDAGENVVIHCGKVVTMNEMLRCDGIVVEISGGEDGKDKMVKVDGVRVKGVPTGCDTDKVVK